MLEAGTFADVAVGRAGLAKPDTSEHLSIAGRLCSSDREEVHLKVRSRPLLPVDPSSRRGIETLYNDVGDGANEESSGGGNHAHGGDSSSAGKGATSAEATPQVSLFYVPTADIWWCESCSQFDLLPLIYFNLVRPFRGAAHWALAPLLQDDIPTSNLGGTIPHGLATRLTLPCALVETYCWPAHHN